MDTTVAVESSASAAGFTFLGARGFLPVAGGALGFFSPAGALALGAARLAPTPPALVAEALVAFLLLEGWASRSTSLPLSLLLSLLELLESWSSLLLPPLVSLPLGSSSPSLSLSWITLLLEARSGRERAWDCGWEVARSAGESSAKLC